MEILSNVLSENIVRGAKKKISMTKVYKVDTTAGRKKQIVIKALAIHHGLDLMNKLEEMKTVEDMLEFQRNYTNKYVENEMRCQVETYLTTGENPELTDLIVHYGEVINGFGKEFIEGPDLEVIEPLTESKVYDFVHSAMKALKIKGKSRKIEKLRMSVVRYVDSLDACSLPPQMQSKRNNKRAMEFFVMNLAIGSLVPKGKLNDYILYCVEMYDNYSVSMNAMKRISAMTSQSVESITVFMKRNEELYDLFSYIAYNPELIDDAFKEIVTTTVYCTEKGIKSYLEVTNCIMNNLIVLLVAHDSMINSLQKSLVTSLYGAGTQIPLSIYDMCMKVKAYVVLNYSNKHKQVYCTKPETAIRKAVSASYKYETDIFDMK